MKKEETLNENVKNKLKDWAEETGREFDELVGIFREEYQNLKGRVSKEVNIEKLALYGVATRIRPSKGMKRRKPIVFYGFKIGDMGIRDNAKRIRDYANKFLHRYGKVAAKSEGLINDQEEVLYPPNYKEFGKESLKRGQVLSPNTKILSRNLWMIVKERLDSKDWELALLQTSDNALAKAWDDVPYFKSCSFPALLKGRLPYLQLIGSTAKETRSVFTSLPKEKWNIHQIFENTLKPACISLKDVENHHEATKDAWDRHIVVKGIVAWINKRNVPSWLNGKFLLVDAEHPLDAESAVRVFVPEHVPLEFGAGSEVHVFGRTRRGKFMNDVGELEEADVVIDAFGILPSEGLVTLPEEEEFEVEEEEFSGWID